MIKSLLLKCSGLLLFAALTLTGSGQEIVVSKFSVESGKTVRYDTPVSVSLLGLDYNTDKGALRLYELKGKERVEVSCQLENGNAPRLWWMMGGETPANTSRKFLLVKDSTYKAKNRIIAQLNPKALVMKMDGKNILQYNTAENFPPDSVSALYKRSGFIHPLWSPSGNVLTRINAPDHWHHYGIWNPWTKTMFEGHTTDFWNLYEGQGTVKFAGFNSLISGPVYGGFRVRQEHVDFQCKGGDKVALNEEWDVRIWNVSNTPQGKVWLWDLTTTLNCASMSPILLEAYRYGGGIGFRASDEWNDNNSWTMTSEGKDRKTADGSRARWCDVGGEFKGNGTSGIVFMSHPSNREFPEPMRVWPPKMNGHGDVYFEFCPIRDKDWKIQPGNDYVLRYRMLVYDGKIDKQTAERLWSDFAYPPAVNVEK